STAVPVPPPTMTFIKDDKYTNQTEMYTQGLIRAKVKVKFYAGFQSEGCMIYIYANADGVQFGEVQEPTTTSSGLGIEHGYHRIVNGMYTLTGISVNVESNRNIVIRLTMATVSDTSDLQDGHVYTWQASLSCGGVEEIQTLDFTANLEVVEEVEIPELKFAEVSENVLHPGDQISGKVTATFPQYFYGSFKITISTVYNETTNSIFGYFTQEPRKFMTDSNTGISWHDTHSFIGSTMYLYEVQTSSSEKANFPGSLERDRQANIEFNFILSNTPDIQNDTNYIMFATLETENTDVVHTGLEFTTDLTTQLSSC
ncbi:uncharacterized protein LOC117111473, partial [Anneissia japonica]|uniref:uncharacterized protein LOC117111473 n=1 Tax=Anneissia japonica TaxID=1529436 RepID=UPI0014259696